MHRRTIIVASIGVHAAFAFALFAAGVWHLQRLDAGHRRFDLAIAEPPPPAPSGSAPAAHALHIVPKVHRRIVHEPVQPTLRTELQVTTDPPGSGTGSGSDSGGTGSGSGSGSGGTGVCTVPGCGIQPQAAPPPPPPPQTVTLPPTVLGALRISGDTQIQPPDTVKIALARDGRSRTTAIFEVCLDTAGGVHGVRALRSSGYSAYDQRLAEAIWHWRYRPYKVGGQPVPACGVVSFEYRNE